MVSLKGFYQLLVCLGGALLFCAPLSGFADDDQGLGDMFSDIEESGSGNASGRQQEVSELERPVTDLLDHHSKRKFSGWGSYTREFKDLCSAIASDGRELQLKAISDRFLVREPECPACYPLMKIVSRSCSPKKIAVSKKKSQKKSEEENAETESVSPEVTAPLRLQREPNLRVDVGIEGLLLRLASDGARRDEGMIALKQLSERLVSAEYQQLPGERDYFRAIQASLDEFLDQQELFRRDSQPHGDGETSIHVGAATQESVDELFDYD